LIGIKPLQFLVVGLKPGLAGRFREAGLACPVVGVTPPSFLRRGIQPFHRVRSEKGCRPRVARRLHHRCHGAHRQLHPPLFILSQLFPGDDLIQLRLFLKRGFQIRNHAGGSAWLGDALVAREDGLSRIHQRRDLHRQTHRIMQRHNGRATLGAGLLNSLQEGLHPGVTAVESVRAPLAETLLPGLRAQLELGQPLPHLLDGCGVGLWLDLAAVHGDAGHVPLAHGRVVVLAEHRIGPLHVAEADPHPGGVLGVADGDDAGQGRRTVARTAELCGDVVPHLERPDAPRQLGEEAVGGDEVFVPALASFVVDVDIAAAQQAQPVVSRGAQIHLRQLRRSQMP
jgi:hypothetical protein